MWTITINANWPLAVSTIININMFCLSTVSTVVGVRVDNSGAPLSWTRAIHVAASLSLFYVHTVKAAAFLNKNKALFNYMYPSIHTDDRSPPRSLSLPTWFNRRTPFVTWLLSNHSPANITRRRVYLYPLQSRSYRRKIFSFDNRYLHETTYICSFTKYCQDKVLCNMRGKFTTHMK